MRHFTMRRYSFFIVSLFIFCTNFAVGQVKFYGFPSISTSSNDLLITFLGDSLWTPTNAYDATHYLQIPLHYAYITNDTELINAFENHFRQMVNAYKQDNVNLSRLNELQYLTLASRYISLFGENSKTELTEELAYILHERYRFYWLNSPAWQWDHEAFQGGIRERLLWKLSNPNTRRKFHKAIIDEDLFIIGIASDLYNYYENDKAKRKAFLEPLFLFNRIIKSRITTKQGWNFQKNYWIDHRDYAYTAYYTQPDSCSPKIRAHEISEDCSHSMRWPLRLIQVGNVIDIERYQKQLRWQLLNVIINTNQESDITLLNNFVDGQNGYFRWGYVSHKGKGYGPYQMSSSFSLGWWSFLGDKEIAYHYYKTRNAFPLNEANMKLYATTTNRKRHPLIMNDTTNQKLRENISAMSIHIALNYNKIESQAKHKSIQALIFDNLIP